MIFDIIREAYKIVKANRKEAVAKAERKRIAKHFNDLYTYRVPWQNENGERMTKGTAMWDIFPKAGHAWMCPDCNKIHFGKSVAL